MDCKLKIAACVRGAILLTFVLNSAAVSTRDPAADPSALSSTTLHGLAGHRIKLGYPTAARPCYFLFDRVPDLE